MSVSGPFSDIDSFCPPSVARTAQDMILCGRKRCAWAPVLTFERRPATAVPEATTYPEPAAPFPDRYVG